MAVFLWALTGLALPGDWGASVGLFAVLNVAATDTYISTWRIKFDFNFWRPITAIQVTFGNTSWLPLLPATPPFPVGARVGGKIGRYVVKHAMRANNDHAKYKHKGHGTSQK